jgi:hypothetical protein
MVEIGRIAGNGISLTTGILDEDSYHGKCYISKILARIK